MGLGADTLVRRRRHDATIIIDGAVIAQYRNMQRNLGGFDMESKTVTRAQLGEAVYQEVGLSRHESAEMVESILAEISGALQKGDMVKISSFGSFSVRRKGERIGRNPKTGQEVPILPRTVLIFRPSHVLKNRINEGA